MGTRLGIDAPTALHQLNDELLRLLMLPQAPGVALALQARFLEAALGVGWQAWSAYGISIAVHLARAVPRRSFLGWSPNELARLRELLSRCSELETIDIAGAKEWRELAARAIEHLGRVQGATEALLQGDESTVVGIDESEAVGRVLVPVVAGVLTNSRVSRLAAGLERGQLLSLSIQVLTSRDRQESPRVVVEGELQGNARDAFEQALAALRSLGPRHGPRWRQLVLHATWGQAGAQLAGRSAGLGCALAALSAWNTLAPGWKAQVLTQGIAATGILSGSRVLPVASASIGLKARACFFAPVRLLLVPRSQLDLTESALAALRKEFPERQLCVRGIDELSQARTGSPWIPGCSVFASIRRTWRGTVASYAIALARSRARRIVAVVTLLLLAVIIGWVSVVTRNEPVHASWEGAHVVLRNAHDWVTLKLHLPMPPLPGTYPRTTWGGPIHLWDLAGDETRELLVLHCTQMNIADQMSLFDRQGELIWRRSAASGPPEGPPEDADLRWWRLFGPLPGPDRRPGFLCLRRSAQRGACYIEFIDGPTGESLGRLHNAGHIDLITRVDMDGDGSEDLVALGTHMPSASGMLAVLEAESLATQRTSSPDLRAHRPGAVDMDDPASLGKGVRMAMLFTKDRFTVAERVHCTGVACVPGGGVRVDVSGDREYGAFQYTFVVRSPTLIDLQEVGASDGELILIRNQADTQVTQEMIDAECARLQKSIRVLSSNGWIAPPRLRVSDGQAGDAWE